MSMTRRSLLSHAAAAALAAATHACPGPSLAQSRKTTLKVQYAWARTYQPIMEEIARRFAEQQPGIRVEFVAPANDYEDMAQRSLRAAITGGVPDVAFQGIHRADLLAS